jgi:hypothetical protein
LCFEVSLGKSYVRTHLNRKKLGVVAYTCHPSQGKKLKIGGLWFGDSLTKNPISKITKAKRGRDVA